MSRYYKGIFWILFSTLNFSIMNLLVPLATHVTTMQKAFFRNFISLLVALIILILTNKKQSIKELKHPKQTPWFYLILRATFGTLGLFTLYYALEHIYISDVTVLSRISPFATVLFSAIFLKEKFEKYNLVALFIAFIGIIFVVKPTMASSNLLPYSMALLGGIFSGGAYTCVRHLNQLKVTPAFIIVFFSAFSCLTTLPAMFSFTMPPLHIFVILIGIGCFAALGQVGITFAYKFAPASKISIFDYSAIIFSGVLGFIFLNQTPDIYSLIGYGIVFSSGLLTFIYNKKRVKS